MHLLAYVMVCVHIHRTNECSMYQVLCSCQPLERGCMIIRGISEGNGRVVGSAFGSLSIMCTRQPPVHG